MVGTADTVLIREVSLIQSVLYREVSLYCMPYANVHTYKLFCYWQTIQKHMHVVNQYIMSVDGMYVFGM